VKIWQINLSGGITKTGWQLFSTYYLSGFIHRCTTVRNVSKKKSSEFMIIGYSLSYFDLFFY